MKEISNKTLPSHLKSTKEITLTTSFNQNISHSTSNKQLNLTHLNSTSFKKIRLNTNVLK